MSCWSTHWTTRSVTVRLCLRGCFTCTMWDRKKKTNSKQSHQGVPQHLHFSHEHQSLKTSSFIHLFFHPSITSATHIHINNIWSTGTMTTTGYIFISMEPIHYCSWDYCKETNVRINLKTGNYRLQFQCLVPPQIHQCFFFYIYNVGVC